jgi:TPR repeat protein
MFALTCVLAYRLRVNISNPLLSLVAPVFTDVESAFYDLGNHSAAAWLAGAGKRGEHDAYVLLAVLLRYCSVLLRDEVMDELCEDRASACTCEELALETLRLAYGAGSSEAAQAIAAHNWTRGSGHVRLHAATTAAHDGAWPKERPPTPPAELPAAVLFGDATACHEAASLLLPIAIRIERDAGPKAAVVPVSLRRLELRWGGSDPKDAVRDEHHRAATAGLAWAVRARGYYALTADGVEANLSAARADFESSARVGDGYARFKFGYMHLKGHGVPRDVDKAVELFEEAAALGVHEALNALGVAHFNGASYAVVCWLALLC